MRTSHPLRSLVLLLLAAHEVIAQAATNVTVTIEDTNDHAPVFSQDRYVVSIEENVPPMSPISDLSMSVSDSDQGANAEFRIYLSDYTNIFEVQPAAATGFTTARIVVKHPELIDYENKTEYTIQVVAMETNTTAMLAGNATLVVRILDENDNSPIFTAPSYNASVRESAPEHTSILQVTALDIDSGINGNTGVRYRIRGNGATRFRMDRRTGELSVAPCATPGTGNCLDYENKKVYDLTVEAIDRFGEGNGASVSLTIYLIDENDNKPQFHLPSYEGYVEEGRHSPDPPIIVQAVDADSPNNEGHFEYRVLTQVPVAPDSTMDLWTVDRRTGVINATRPVPYPDFPDTFYQLEVIADDGQYRDTATVKINVRDINDNRPIFIEGGRYRQTILEDSPPGTIVYNVTATDKDPANGPNGQVHYRITGGAFDKFLINDTTGLVSVAPGATFDADVTSSYTLLLIALDSGQPKLSSTATLVIIVQDVNNRSPYFQPEALSGNVSEGAPLRTLVGRMIARDQDLNASLVYSFVNFTATDPKGVPVNPDDVDFQSWFVINNTTGEVRVSGPVTQSQAAVIVALVQVTDLAGGPDQKGYGTYTITVVKPNTDTPVFGGGWNSSHPFIIVTMREERPEGDTVVHAKATDPDTPISYRLLANHSYLSIDVRSGLVRISSPIDYETIRQVQAVVVATDSGVPQLTATATIIITVENINDNAPVFTKAIYNAIIPENSPSGTVVTTVNATDLDPGDFGIVSYVITESRDLFQIDNVTGVISVKPGAVLDIETTPQFTVIVRASDSPGDSSDRKYATVPVTVTLTDLDDNPLTFTQDIHYAVVYDTSPIDTEVLRVTAADKDVTSQPVTYTISCDNDPCLFKINTATGQIRIRANLTGQLGVYNLSVRAVDAVSGEGPVTDVVVTVVHRNSGPPTWHYPPNDNHTFDIVENTKPHVLIDNTYNATDEDGTNVTYAIFHDNQFVNETLDFAIDPSTGQVRALRSFDHERTTSYTLWLAARDSGTPRMSALRSVTYRIIDVNDNEPLFPKDSACCPLPVHLSIWENSTLNTRIGQVIATDLDTGNGGDVTYDMTLVGAGADVFLLDPDSGYLILNTKLDYTRQADYILRISASNSPAAESSVPDYCDCKNASSVFVYIHVIDVNNLQPAFAQGTYNTCIALNARVDTSIYRVTAVDLDTEPDLTYTIRNLVAFKGANTNSYSVPADTFYMSNAGSVHNKYLMTTYENNHFEMNLNADDSVHTATASFMVWVVESDTEVTLTINKDIEEVEADIETIKRIISEKTNWGVVCVTGIRFHITDAGIVRPDWTDIRLHVVDGRTKFVYTTTGLLDVLDSGFLNAYGFIAIKESFSFWDGFDIDPVLGAVIAIILLLLLALLLFCCCWCICALCCPHEEETEYFVPEMVNPIWKKKFYEDQELCMAVLDAEAAEDRTVTMHGTYDNDGFVSASANGTATVVANTTRTETFTTSSFQQSGAEMSNGHAANLTSVPRIETTLERSANAASLDTTDAIGSGAGFNAVGSGAGFNAVGSGAGFNTVGSGAGFNATALAAPLITVAAPAHKPRSVSSGTMTEGGVQYERTQGGAYEAEFTGYTAPDYGSMRPSRVGASLSRPTTPTYARSPQPFSTLGSQASPAFDHDFDFGRGPVDQYDVDAIDLARMSSGVQTANMLGTHSYRGAPPQQYRAYTASIPDDYHTEVSMSPSWAGDDFPDGLYQGEIRLGAVHSNPPSVMNAGEPDYYEDRYMTSTSQRLN